MEHPHQVVTVGGGFGGLYAAQSLRGAPVQVTVLPGFRSGDPRTTDRLRIPKDPSVTGRFAAALK